MVVIGMNDINIFQKSKAPLSVCDLHLNKKFVTLSKNFI
jgi:hypothetical protein